MGDMYDKYDKFTLKLATTGTSGNVTLSGSNMGFIVYNLKGLDWINLYTDLAPKSQVWAPVAYVQSAAGTPSNGTTGYANIGQGFNFRKSKEVVDLTFAVTALDALGIGENYLPPTTNTYNDVVFQFIIEPVIEGLMNECASFTFATNPSLTVQNRTVNTNRTSYNYVSFDMYSLCKEFWNLHEEFEIFMSYYAVLGTGTLSGNALIMNVEMQGLNWSNNLVKQGNDTNGTNTNYTTSNAIVGGIVNGSSGSTHWIKPHYNSAPVQFYKSSNFINLVINFKNYDNTTLYPATTFTGLNPRYQVSFYIRPIYKVPKATLFINPFGLTTTETNLGITNNTNSFTLKNIDMRLLCRNMWEKYDKFNIFLSVITTTNASINGTNGSYLLQLSGLDFINQTLVYSNKAITQNAVIGSVFTQLTANFADSMGAMSSLATSFYKTKDIVDLTFTAIPRIQPVQ